MPGVARSPGGASGARSGRSRRATRATRGGGCHPRCCKQPTRSARERRGRRGAWALAAAHAGGGAKLTTRCLVPGTLPGRLPGGRRIGHM
ncbi:hypothetical protein PAI11_36250 [Patulibacter medicamentivorans]|uniref:Uncharacterized protein n=1 Tax=Patulibacter medicamentivorans TaxID=1097667 RepID=H0E9V2_9ACTN|nr:hypothetical protein PAI11_36250 [Patulibacter medicamentivorans]